MASVWNRRVSRLVGWLLAVFVLVAGGLVAAPAHAEGAGSISGVVTDEAGSPASGVQVFAHRYNAAWGSWMWGSLVQTAPDGSYTLADLPDGDYRLEFRAGLASTNLIPEWWDDATDLWSATTITVSGGNPVAGIDPILSAGASITGVVTDESGAGVRGVSVRATDSVTGAWVSTALTDGAGSYRIGGLRGGHYFVEFAPLADSGPVAGEWWDDAASRSDAAVVTTTAGAETAGIDAVLSAAGSISGVVTDSTGAPAANVMVAVYRSSADGTLEWANSTSVGPSGGYVVPGLRVGDYKVSFSTGGSLLGEWFDDASDASSATVVPVTGGAATTADAVLTTGASIAGVVTDEAGQPVQDATVWARRVTENGLGPGAGAATAADGSYSLVGLAPGDYKVRFDTAQASPTVAGEWWDDAKTEDAAVVLTLAAAEVAGDISPRLAPGGEITGTVVDGAGAPLTSGMVMVYDANQNWLQNTGIGLDGSYRFGGLDAGAYRVGFVEYRNDGSQLSEWWNNAPDFASANDIVVGVGETVGGIDATIAEDDGSVLETFTASLSGTVTDALGNPLAQAGVSVDGGTWGDGLRTDAEGRWSLDRMPAGSYTVSFTAEVDGVLYTQWWNAAADRESAEVIKLGNAEQRTGIDAILGAPVLPVLESSIPKISGPLHVGATLKAHARDWTDGTQFAYEWFADGVPIPGENGQTLPVTPALVGMQISAEVTGSQAGYQSVTATSAQTDPVLPR